MEEAQLSVRNLCVNIGGKRILDAVSMDINRGRITAIIGPSGCGKSTFIASLNQLSRTIPGVYSTGSIEYDNEDVLEPNTDLIKLRRNIGMIFQQPNPFPLSIRKNLDLPLREHGVKDKELRSKK